MNLRCVLALALASCGRIGFDQGADSISDAVDRGDARVEPSAPFPVGFGTGMERNPAVAWDGTQFVVGWNDARGRQGDGAIAGSLVSPTMVVQPPGVWLGMGFIQSQGPSIACNATAQCAIVSGDFTSSSALGRALVTNGTPSVSNTLINRASNLPAVASNGTSFLVVYNDGLTPSVNAVMLDAGGALASTPKLLVTPLGTMQAAAATATGYLAAWERGSMVEYAMLDPGGVPLGPNQMVPGPDSVRPAAASSPTVSLLVWNELGSHVRATRITSDGTQLDVPPLSISQASTAARPTVTWDGVTFLVAWERKLDLTTAGLAAVAIDPDTGAIGPETELTPAANPVTDTVPACASDGAGTSLCVFQRTIVSQLIFGIVIKR